jgi:hypothetical protein
MQTAPNQLLLDDLNEPELYLFNTQSKNEMLRFVRLMPTDYPLRVLLGNADLKSNSEDSNRDALKILKDGTKYFLVFLTMN